MIAQAYSKMLSIYFSIDFLTINIDLIQQMNGEYDSEEDDVLYFDQPRPNVIT